MWSTQSLLDSRYLIVEREIGGELVALGHGRLRMLDAGQYIEWIHVVHVLNAKLEDGRRHRWVL